MTTLKHIKNFSQRLSQVKYLDAILNISSAPTAPLGLGVLTSIYSFSSGAGHQTIHSTHRLEMCVRGSLMVCRAGFNGVAMVVRKTPHRSKRFVTVGLLAFFHCRSQWPEEKRI